MTTFAEVELKRWSDANGGAGVTGDVTADIDAIFFETSATQTFPGQPERDAFRERWLGRYLAHDAQWFYVALSGGRAVGYLAGCVEDPALSPRFADIPYFGDLADLTRAYPAHLHVNLHQEYRNGGLGGRLIDRFADDARAAGAIGMHVVTGAQSRNRTFYAREGFVPLRELPWGPQGIVFLGRTLAA